MSRFFSILSPILIALFLFTSCEKDDDYVYPPVTTELLCVKTNLDGRVHSLITDYGKIYTATNGAQLIGLKADTVYRMQCMYDAETPEVEGMVDVYSLRGIVSSKPFSLPDSEEKRMDPVDIESIWLSGDYLNFSAMVKIQESLKHIYHFVNEGSIQESAEGEKTLSLSFYHDRGDDVEGYTQRTYFSVPLSGYYDVDRIAFTVNTYKKGLRTWYFTMERN